MIAVAVKTVLVALIAVAGWIIHPFISGLVVGLAVASVDEDMRKLRFSRRST